MTKKTFTFPSATVTYYFDADFTVLEKLVAKEQTIIITDDNVALANKRKLKGWKTITIAHGEAQQDPVNS
jgi:3-dehydroquinate synthase